ncbi:MAG: SDR family NAD(P)-dependent oxidoreductase [Solirubrobacteraceae bacterium]|nr:SDR family NAD(P)-dependent oxidoreductase [Solirubrobacteraceae bacterium]
MTGASRGLGRALAQAALEAGDTVVATARRPADLDGLAAAHPGRAFALELDVTDRDRAFAVADEAVALAGGLDVVVNCAGYGLHAPIEETSEAAARAQMETNFFGALWVTQAVAGHLRRAGAGHLVQVSSAAGGVAFPLVGLYCASKYALEGMSESLARELAPFGVKVTILQPSDFRTGFRDACDRRIDPGSPYAAAFPQQLAALSEALSGREAGDPERAARVLLELVAMPDPPLRLLLGEAAFENVTRAHARQLDEWRAHEALARSADGPPEEESR